MTKLPDNFRSMSDELDRLIDKLQDGDLDIDQAAKAYEQGMELIKKLEQHLKTAQNKVTKIKSNFDK